MISQAGGDKKPAPLAASTALPTIVSVTAVPFVCTRTSLLRSSLVTSSVRTPEDGSFDDINPPWRFVWGGTTMTEE